MKPAQPLLAALVAVMLVTSARPTAGDEQFPRGLMSAAAPTKSRTCTINVRPVSFGTYDPLAGAALDAVGQVIYMCGNLGASALAPDNDKKAIRIELETGLANSFSPRAMYAGATERLEYNLYLDATHQTVWGQGAFGTDVYVDSKPPNKTPVIVPIFGRIRSMQDVPVGQYLDSLLARIVF
jgi:spore coat protein U-like protein